MGSWIWKFGEFEKYHNMLLHSRRHNYGYPEPPVWKIYPPEPAVRFTKQICCEGGKINIKALGDISTTLYGSDFPDGELKLWGKHELELPAGRYRIQIRVMNTETFPSIKVDGVIETDESWLADDCTGNWSKVGVSGLFEGEDETKQPDIFPFEYTKAEPKLVETARVDDGEPGLLFDFGREIFGKIHISGIESEQKEVRVILGESKEEALNAEWSYTRFVTEAVDGRIDYEPYAFRYIFVGCKKAEIVAEEELLKVEQRGKFSCNEEIINKVIEVAEYTFHLNTREFYLDGIKRDRWVWSADAYQSCFVNHYLYMDQETEKRTLTALGGGLPVVGYINTIMDYSYFWLISLWDYYLTYGDKNFIAQIYPQAKAVMEFCNSRRSSDGFVRGIKNDWVFIDWAPIDKKGALLGEQILLCKAMECFGKMEQLVAELCPEYENPPIEIEEMPQGGSVSMVWVNENKTTGIDWDSEAEHLRNQIIEKYYDSEKEVFIDSFESGRRNVTRQNNLLAYLFLGVSDKIKKNIYEKVVCNPEVTAITTPYFKFYENQVICEEGDMKLLEESLRNYYGSMLKLGATTLYEQYDPNQTGIEHYAMYGRAFEKSLCHAWSCSPIYLLGRYRMGVKNTGVAYDTFTVEPCLGDLKEFTGTVPLPGGYVQVSMNEKELTVMATQAGGTLKFHGKEIKLDPCKEISVKIEGLH